MLAAAFARITAILLFAVGVASCGGGGGSSPVTSPSGAPVPNGVPIPTIATTPIAPPTGINVISGLSAGDGLLVVPAGNTLSAFTLSTNP